MKTKKIEIELKKEVKTIRYTKFLFELVKITNNKGIKAMTLTTKNAQQQTSVLVYINQEGISQTDELTLFSGLQNKIMQKEQYKYQYLSMYIQIEVYLEARNTLKNASKLIKKHTI